MGVRKRKSAEELKEARKHVAFAKLTTAQHLHVRCVSWQT